MGCLAIRRVLRLHTHNHSDRDIDFDTDGDCHEDRNGDIDPVCDRFDDADPYLRGCSVECERDLRRRSTDLLQRGYLSGKVVDAGR
jgi:hypothetical protein